MDRQIPRVKDASLIKSMTMPNGNEAVVTSAAFHLQSLSSLGGNFLDCELLIEAPALTDTELPNAKELVYSVQTDNDAAFGSSKTIADRVGVQTGVTTTGAAAANFRVRLPSDCENYVRVAATNPATGAGDASGKAATVSLVF